MCKENTGRQVRPLPLKELNQLLSVVDTETWPGRRDYVLIAFLYVTGARLSELISVRLEDLLDGGREVSVRLTGRDGTQRLIPIESEQAFLKTLRSYVRLCHDDSKPGDFLFYTRGRQGKAQLSRTTVDALLKKYALKVREKEPDFPSSLSASSLRLSRALELCAAEVPLQVVGAFLGLKNPASLISYLEPHRHGAWKFSELKLEPLPDPDPDTLALKRMGLL